MLINPLNSAIIGVLQKKIKVDIVKLEFVLILADKIVFVVDIDKIEDHNV
jgi:hypothetical protein